MEGLLNLHALSLFLIFVVPGFVAMKAHDLVVPTARRNFGESIIEVISYSMVNLALLFWAVSLLHSGEFSHDHAAQYFLGMFFVLFVAPAGWALLTLVIRRSKLFRRFVLQPHPTAWDAFFYERERLAVLCHLKDGSTIGGVYSSRSHTAHFPHPQDIYIEEMWTVNEEGRFAEMVPDSRGLLVRADECRFMQFFELEDEE